MKVLHVITGISRKGGGPSRSSQGLVAALCKAGVDAWIYSFDGAEPWIPGVRKVKIGLGLGSRSTVELKSFDLVHIHGIWDLRLHKVAVACRKAGVPYVIAPRGMLEPWSLKQKWLKKRVARWLYQDRDLRGAAALHATAESEAEQFRRLGFKNKIIVSPNGVNVPEGDIGLGQRSRSTAELANSSGVGRRMLAERKVEEWLEGVTEKSFCAALERLVEEKSKAGEYRFRNDAERVAAIAGAVKFFGQFSRKIVQLSDGRCVYFVPDARAKNRHKDNATSWAEYAFHAVSNGGARIPEKGYNERLYNPHKAANFNLIEVTLKAERCYVRLDPDSRYDAIMFDGGVMSGLAFQVVARLDVCGNIEANLTEVTFTSSSKRVKKAPRLVALAEAVQAVVHHQTTPGSCPQDKDSISNRSPLRKGVRRALFVSRMHPKKGVLELVESWARVKKEAKAKSLGEQWICELVYTMNSEEERAYEQKVKDRILALDMSYQDKDGTIHSSTSTSNFDFVLTGPLDDDAKWSAYARADLFVLPTYSENFGIVVAEALWAGAPVITTKGTPWAELECSASSKFQVPSSMLEERCGWWIELPESKSRGEVEQWNALDSALREAIEQSNNRTILQEMGRRGRKLVEERYTWSAVCDKMLQGYEEVLK